MAMKENLGVYRAPFQEDSSASDMISLDHVQEALALGASLGSLRGMNADLEAALYAVGVQAYQLGDYESAQRSFRFLALHEHRHPVYWRAYGMSAKLCGDTPLAIRALLISCSLHPQVDLCLELARLYLSVDEKICAQHCLEAAGFFVQAEGSERHYAPQITSLEKAMQLRI